MLLSVIAILFSYSVFGSGISPFEDVIMLVSSKQACDSAVPGFREKTEAVYKRWAIQNARWMEMMERANYDGMIYPVFIEKLKEEFLAEFSGQLQIACDRVVTKLEK